MNGLKVCANFLVLVYFFSFTTANATQEFSAEMACFKALSKIFGQPGYYLKNDTVFIPAVRDYGRGFYLFTENGAYFHRLSPQPSSKIEMTYYELNLQTPGKEQAYITYSYNSKNEGNSGLAEVTPGSSTHRIESKGVDAMDSKSRKIIWDAITQRLNAIKSKKLRLPSHNNNKKRPIETAGSGPGIKVNDKADALNTCESVDNKQVREAVNRARENSPPTNNTPVNAHDSGSTGRSSGTITPRP